LQGTDTKATELSLTLVDQRKFNWRSLGVSFAAQSLGVLALIQLGLIHPQELVKPLLHARYVELAAPQIEPQAHPTQRMALKQPPSQIKPKMLAPTPLEMAKLEPVRTVTAPKPKLQEVEPPRVVMHNFPAPELARAPMPKLAPQVQTGTFSEGSSAKPALAKVEPRNVQTGGFGDPNGINGEQERQPKLAAARMGGFDMPLGGGYGNGTGNAKGTRGTVASAGFGNGVATQVPNVPSVRAIAQSGFGDARPASEAPRVPKVVPAAATSTPVEIISKPVPAYTEEARALKLEGEVLLEVNFAADGRPNIQRVVRGLGHGLDENAVKAAQKIKYKPAKRDGQPVDSVATLHVVFQLAY
jgi:TonB family protein